MKVKPGNKLAMSEGVESDAQCRRETKQKTDSTDGEGDLKLPTADQVKLIGSTWEIVSKDLEGAGLIMFKK